MEDQIKSLREKLLEGQKITFHGYPGWCSECRTITSTTHRQSVKIKGKVIKKYQYWVLIEVICNGRNHLEGFGYFDLIEGGWSYGL